MTNIPQDHAAVTFCMSYVCSIRSPSLVWWGPARVADFTLLFKESFFFFHWHHRWDWCQGSAVWQAWLSRDTVRGNTSCPLAGSCLERRSPSAWLSLLLCSAQTQIGRWPTSPTQRAGRIPPSCITMSWVDYWLWPKLIPLPIAPWPHVIPYPVWYRLSFANTCLISI